jgi:hypothetical protein
VYISKRTFLSILIGVVTGLAINAYTATPQARTQAGTTKPAVTTTHHNPTPAGEVAGAQTTVSAPANVDVVVTDNRSTKAKPVAKTANAVLPTPLPVLPAEPQTETPAPSAPAGPTPETIVVNLKTPQTYSIPGGQTSPELYHEMIDDVQYEWQAGLRTYWQNETPATDEAVWATINLDKPSTPYVSDILPFTIHTKPDVTPGVYKVRFTVIIRAGVSLDVPVVVTVTDK